MTEIETIAGKLTKAQREAVLTLKPFIGVRWPVVWFKNYNGIYARTLSALNDKGLIYSRNEKIIGLSPLGQAVRDYLKGQPC